MFQEQIWSRDHSKAMALMSTKYKTPFFISYDLFPSIWHDLSYLSTFFLVQPHFHAAGAGAYNEHPLNSKLPRFQAGNNDILIQGR